MIDNNIVLENTYVSDGVTKKFFFDFRLFRAEELEIITYDDRGRETLLPFADYAVTPIKGTYMNGGYFILVTAFPDTTPFVARANYRVEQPTDLTESTPLEEIEKALDRITLIAKSIKGIYESLTNVPIAAARAGKYAIWDENGDWSTAISTLHEDASALGLTLIEQLTEQAMRETLGLTAGITAQQALGLGTAALLDADVDITLGDTTPSDQKVPTQVAVKSYVDAQSSITETNAKPGYFGTYSLWDSATTYVAEDVVIDPYDHMLYEAVEGSTAVSPHDNPASWKGMAGGASQSDTTYTAGAAVTALKVVVLDSNGEIVHGDKRYSDLINAIGVSLASGAEDAIIPTRRFGRIEGLSGLTPGAAYFLGEDGGIEIDGEVEDDEYRLYVGLAVNASTLDINIQEATLNSPQDTLTIKAFKGKKTGLDVYYVSSQLLKVRIGACHVNDGIVDWWVERSEEFTLDSSTPNWPSNGQWKFICIDRFGNITLETTTGSSYQRPTRACYQWGELAGTGYSHERSGYYYHDGTNWTGKRIIGSVNKVSDIVFYFINQLDGSDEEGTCIDVRVFWRRIGRIQIESVFWTPSTTGDDVPFAVPFSSTPYNCLISVSGNYYNYYWAYLTTTTVRVYLSTILSAYTVEVTGFWHG